MQNLHLILDVSFADLSPWSAWGSRWLLKTNANVNMCGIPRQRSDDL